MKRPEYVAAASATALGVLENKNVAELRKCLEQIFSRSGFTDGYYNNKIGRPMFGIRTKEDVQNTAAVYRNLHDLYRNERRLVALNAEVELSAEVVRLTLNDGINSVTVSCNSAEPARSKPADYDYLYRSFSKLGGTPYYLDDFKAEIGEGLAISAAALNDLRRRAVEDLSALRAKPRKVTKNIPEFIKLQKAVIKPKLLLQFARYENIPANLPDCAAVILPVETDFSAVKLSVPVWADMPRGIMDNEARYAAYLQKAKQNGVKIVLCGTLSAMELCIQNGLEPFADFSFNICNSHALRAIKALGAKGSVLSFENSLNTAGEISGELPTALIVYGHLPLMLTRNCPNRNGMGCKNCSKTAEMTDRKGETFKITCRNGFSEILNGIPLYMGDRGRETGVCDYHILRFTFENKERIAEVLELYWKGEACPERYTRGLYYKEIG